MATQGVVIGLNSVDPLIYGSTNNLPSCELDTLAIKTLLPEETRTLLLTKKATIDNVTKAIKQLAINLQPNDLGIIYYAGHGTQIPDTSNDELDGLDEAWCLYDGLLIDDTLYELCRLFKKDTRLLLLSDSCHSGTISRSIAKPNDSEIQASIISLSACRDNETATDLGTHGAFTVTLLTTYAISLNYLDLYNRLCTSLIKYHQKPELALIGVLNKSFINSKPLT